MARGGGLQRTIGALQILSGLIYSVYGGAYGGRGGGSYLIGSGIANAGGSKYGTAYKHSSRGFMTDLYGSLGAAGAQYGVQTGLGQDGGQTQDQSVLAALLERGMQQPAYQDELANYIQNYSAQGAKDDATAMAYQRLRELIIGDFNA